MPRQYAAAMDAARTPAATAKVLNSVPRHLRAMVIKHLVSIGNNRKYFHAARRAAKQDRLARELLEVNSLKSTTDSRAISPEGARACM